MRMRGVVAAVLLCGALAAGCSSSNKASVPNVAAGGGAGLGGVPSGVTASGSARQTVPADLAFVVVGLSGTGSNGLSQTIIPGPNGAPISLPTDNPNPKKADHKALRAAITSLGLPEDAVEFSSASSSLDNGDSVLQVEVPVAKLPKIAHDVVDVVTKAGAKISGQGLRLAVSDCATALTSARTKALANARADAQTLAKAGGVSLGQLVSVSEAASTSTSVLAYVTGGTNPCGRGEALAVSGYRPRLASLDAPARVDLTDSVTASFALQGRANRTLNATGQGEATGPADAADIIVAPENGVVFDGSDATTTSIDAAGVVRALRPFGVDEKDIEVENPPNISLDGSFSGSSYVRVHVTIAQLTNSGHQITAAIQSAVHVPAEGDSGPGTVGVLFHASNCRDLRKQARTAAAADARRRIDKLASAAHVHAGAVTGLTESSVLYLPVVDPCEFDIDDLADVGALAGSSYPGIPKLADLDAAPVVTVPASLQMSRALSS